MGDEARNRIAHCVTVFAWACPSCRAGLVIEGDSLRCASCGATFSYLAGIWRFLPEARGAAFAEFLHDYQMVRKAEGWGGANAGYYQSLPCVSTNGPLDATWRIRSRNFQILLDRVILPLETGRSQPLKILDLGAGNGWLSHQLAGRGHRVAAIDISPDAEDGLGAFVWYKQDARREGDHPSGRMHPLQRSVLLASERSSALRGSSEAFIPLQAEFDRLPFLAGQVDLVVFNAALHYSTNYLTTLSEALRVLRADGHLVVLDTPVYRHRASGDQMVREREATFHRTYGISATAIQTEGFLTYGRLEALAKTLDLQLRVIDPVPLWRTTLRAFKIRFRGHREAAGFPILIMRRASATARYSSQSDQGTAEDPSTRDERDAKSQGSR